MQLSSGNPPMQARRAVQRGGNRLAARRAELQSANMRDDNTYLKGILEKRERSRSRNRRNRQPSEDESEDSFDMDEAIKKDANSGFRFGHLNGSVHVIFSQHFENLMQSLAKVLD